ncbi:hypothetical protein ANCDUO_24117 [Ancylostoma duodenale]|uniref:MULE transposase domain-containing protein n=1 Tax=Ancylostoma duodenale TaxID=51022 RepID=A0A0C2C837_9BILA|nr:hypothetical protein ANCDUO_24117 [Ancylostoma duodenale]
MECTVRRLELHVVHGVCDWGVDVPLVYTIMESRKRMAYAKVLGHLKNRLVGFRMDLGSLRPVCDFEKAAIAATRAVFREIGPQGCAFHLALS